MNARTTNRLRRRLLAELGQNGRLLGQLKRSVAEQSVRYMENGGAFANHMADMATEERKASRLAERAFRAWAIRSSDGIAVELLLQDLELLIRRSLGQLAGFLVAGPALVLEEDP